MTPESSRWDRRELLHRGAVVVGSGAAIAAVTACSSASSTAGPSTAPPGSAPPPLIGNVSTVVPPTTAPLDSLPQPVRQGLNDAMRSAIQVAQSAGVGFGAVLVSVADGTVVARAANNVKSGDPSAHAEIEVMRQAGLGGTNLKETVLVTTAESCPMCAACAVYAGVVGVAYGTSLEYLITMNRGSIRISQPQLVAAGPRAMPIVGGVLHEETDPLFPPK